MYADKKQIHEVREGPWWGEKKKRSAVFSFLILNQKTGNKKTLL